MKNIILFVILSFLITGCGSVGTSFFPLSVGNKWNYAMTITCTDTMTTPDSIWVDTSTRTVEITRETTLDNGTGVLETVINLSETLYYQEAGDYVRYFYDKSDEDYYYTELDLPIEEGKTWTALASPFGMVNAVVLGKEDVDVPAGNYDDCWKIGYVFLMRQGALDTTYVYYAEDVGMVKWSLTTHSEPATITTLIELDSATIK